MSDIQGSRRGPRVACLGALVVDLTFWAPRRPEPGETLLGTRFAEFLGGKGFNQAVAAARLGADVTLLGAVGSDDYGRRLLDVLAREGVTPAIEQVAEGTGVGQPLVTDDGEVSIVGIPRANALVSPATVDARADVLAGVDVLMLQCEVPLAASIRAAQTVRDAGGRVMVNPAPAVPEAAALAELADLLILNEVEARMIGAPAGAGPLDAAAALSGRFGCPVVITLGSQGAAVAAGGDVQRVPAHAVESVDPTGAGDAFCAAFTVRTAEGAPPADALAFANAAGACAVTVAGAEPSMPLRAVVEARLATAPR